VSADNDYTISKYDRLYASRQDDSLFTKPSTIKNIEPITGRVETFVVQTARHPERGDYFFIERIDEEGRVTRVALPPRVCDAAASQRESLTAKRRSIAGKAQAKARKERGELPGFLKGKKR
jgi:hypothetical protein